MTIGEDVFEAPLPKRHSVHRDDEAPPERVHCDDAIDLFDDAPMLCADDGLTVDAFEPPPRQAEAQRPTTGGLGLEAALSEFVAAFQRLAVAFA